MTSLTDYIDFDYAELKMTKPEFPDAPTKQIDVLYKGSKIRLK